MKTDFFPQIKRLGCVFLLAWSSFSAIADATNQLPPFDEVYRLLKQNIVGVTGEELNRAAVRGLLKELDSQVSLATNVEATSASTNVLSKATVYDKSFAYIRLAAINGDAAEKLARQYQDFAGTNKIKGLVLDLRFANGKDYTAAAATADKFLNSEQPLLDWGAGVSNSTLKSSPIPVPVAVLVNKQTRGAAEALAAAMRETKVGLLLGSTTAGQASVFKEFPLENGQKLRIAVSPVKVGKNKTISPDGLKPDIEVPVNPEDERSFLDDPYKTLTRPIAAIEMTIKTNTVANADTNTPRSRLNEAELVRRHREGLNTEEEFVEKTVREQGGELKLISDPVLARALDLLKGLAVVQQTRPL
jgi:hypothetical protein